MPGATAATFQNGSLFLIRSSNGQFVCSLKKHSASAPLAATLPPVGEVHDLIGVKEDRRRGVAAAAASFSREPTIGRPRVHFKWSTPPQGRLVPLPS